MRYGFYFPIRGPGR